MLLSTFFKWLYRFLCFGMVTVLTGDGKNFGFDLLNLRFGLVHNPTFTANDLSDRYFDS